MGGLWGLGLCSGGGGGGFIFSCFGLGVGGGGWRTGTSGSHVCGTLLRSALGFSGGGVAEGGVKPALRPGWGQSVLGRGVSLGTLGAGECRARSFLVNRRSCAARFSFPFERVSGGGAVVAWCLFLWVFADGVGACDGVVWVVDRRGGGWGGGLLGVCSRVARSWGGGPGICWGG